MIMAPDLCAHFGVLCHKNTNMVIMWTINLEQHNTVDNLGMMHSQKEHNFLTDPFSPHHTHGLERARVSMHPVSSKFSQPSIII